MMLSPVSEVSTAADSVGGVGFGEGSSGDGSGGGGAKGSARKGARRRVGLLRVGIDSAVVEKQLRLAALEGRRTQS